MEDTTLQDRFRRATLTLYKMFVHHRGYTSMNQIVSRPNVFMVMRGETPSVVIFLLSTDKLNIETVKEMMQVLTGVNVRHAVLVYQVAVTSSARKAIGLLTNYRIELFALHELQYDITTHTYYCPHERIESTSELGFLRNQVSKLPKITLSDPVVRFLGFSKNDILRIRRKDGTLAYRVVR